MPQSESDATDERVWWDREIFMMKGFGGTDRLLVQVSERKWKFAKESVSDTRKWCDQMKGFGGTDRLAASDTLSDTNAFTHLGGLSALFRATQEEEEELFLKEKKLLLMFMTCRGVRLTER